ncbi:MAG: lipoprotein insertase outer membrane protein LolB [Halioglobus sp.]
MRRLLVILSTVSLMLLAGCAGTPQTPPGDTTWETRLATLEALEHWTASGKIALRTAEQSESASMLWQQVGKATHLRLSGPMGISATTIDSDGHQLEIRQGEDYSRWNLDDPDLQTNNEWELPLRSLHHWLKGIPDPKLEVQSLQLDEANQLPAQLQQEGWTVDFQQFSRFDDYQLPTKLEATRGTTRIKILLREWRDFFES